jgi:hypothetical protein
MAPKIIDHLRRYFRCSFKGENAKKRQSSFLATVTASLFGMLPAIRFAGRAPRMPCRWGCEPSSPGSQKIRASFSICLNRPAASERVHRRRRNWKPKRGCPPESRWRCGVLNCRTHTPPKALPIDPGARQRAAADAYSNLDCIRAIGRGKEMRVSAGKPVISPKRTCGQIHR